MDYCYPYMSFHSFFNSFVGLPFFVHRDFHSRNRISRWFSYFYQYFSEILMVLGMVSGVLAIPMFWHDMNILCGCLSSATHTIQMVCKTFYLKLKKEQFLQHLQDLSRIVAHNSELQDLAKAPTEFLQFHLRASRYIRIVETFAFSLYLMVTVMYFTPFYYNAFAHADTFREQQLPILGYFPFDYLASLARFRAVILFQNLCFFFYNLKAIAVDFFLLGVIVLHTSQLRYLNLILEALLEEIDNQEKKPVISRKKRTRFFMKMWMVQHEATLRNVTELKSMFAPYIITEYAYSVFHTCVPAFVITSTLSWTIVQKISLVFFVFTNLTTFYLLSSAGDQLTQASEEMATSFYGRHLVNDDIMMNKVMHKMVVQRIRGRPLALDIYTLFPLGATTFGSILRLVVTYYMALNEIQKIKN